MKEIIAANVREARHRANLTQDELAARIGVSVQALSNIETGSSLPSIITLAAIAGELGLDVGSLIRPPSDDGLSALRARAATVISLLKEKELALAVALLETLRLHAIGHRPAQPE